MAMSTPIVDVGLLVLSTRNLSKLASLLTIAGNSVKSRLYIRVQDTCLHSVLSSIYLQSSQHCPWLDVRVLLGQKLPANARLIGDEVPHEIDVPRAKYKKVVLGGTFDRLHNGHKVLLSKAVLLASESVTCGVTDKEMIKKKCLWEIIEPISKRIMAVQEFIADVSESVVCLAEPIEDPFGPSIRVPDLEAIIVSQETIRGGEAVNMKRQERHLSHLDMVVINLLESSDVVLQETKISSSSGRRAILGTLLKSPNIHKERSIRPYILGLCGGIASGKSNIARILSEQPGFEVIDCDKLAHSCYERSCELTKKIDERFEGVVKDGVVDRKALGKIVFGNQARLSELNNLIWPIIMEKVKDIIANSENDVIVIEAAAIVEAKWQGFMNELWTVFVPHDEAIQRVMSRDRLSKDEAENRTKSQLTNKERIDESHVVFCSLWAFEETREQVMRAVRDLRQRL